MDKSPDIVLLEAVLNALEASMSLIKQLTGDKEKSLAIKELSRKNIDLYQALVAHGQHADSCTYYSSLCCRCGLSKVLADNA